MVREYVRSVSKEQSERDSLKNREAIKSEQTFCRTICVDFDGVINSYNSGWKGVDNIPDEPVPGAIAWLHELIENPGFKPVIYSARSKHDNGIQAMKKWLVDNGFKYIDELEFPTEKPAAWLTVDDRAVCFQGRFPDLGWMAKFKPWNK